MKGHTGLFPEYSLSPRSLVYWGPISEEARSHRSWYGASPGDLHTLFAHCGVGTAGTLPSLGKKLMYAGWGDRPSHSKPSVSISRLLKAESIGARVQGKPGRGFQACDIPSAYPSHYRMHPTGTAVRLYRGFYPEIRTWFMWCRVYVPRELPLGPFPAKVPGKYGRYKKEWPTQPGEYWSWLWAEQAGDTVKAGCDVEPIHGYGWYRMTEDSAWWVDHMIRLRETAPGGRDGVIGQLVKAATNAAIGIQGIGCDYLKLRDDWAPGMVPVTGKEGISTRGGEWVPGRRTMIHWHRYTVMQCGRTMYRLALPYAEAGRLTAIKTDAIEIAA